RPGRAARTGDERAGADARLDRDRRLRERPGPGARGRRRGPARHEERHGRVHPRSRRPADRARHDGLARHAPTAPRGGVVTVTYNPFDPDQVDHDEAILTRLRHEAPVVEIMPGVFYVTRYDDVVEISRDAKRFPQAPFSPLAEDTRTPDELQLGESNPPAHTRTPKCHDSGPS